MPRRLVPALVLLAACMAEGTPAPPGEVRLRRLSRAEYDFSLRDLLGTERSWSEPFPPDDEGLGFDNIADVLATSPLLLELLAEAAQGVVNEALGSTPNTLIQGSGLEGPQGAVWHDRAWRLEPAQGTAAGAPAVQIPLRAPSPGRYHLELGLDAPEGPTAVRLEALGHAAERALDGPARLALELVVTSTLALSEATLSLAGPGALLVSWARLDGPAGEAAPGHLCADAGDEPTFLACARGVLTPFLHRAHRRPVEEPALERYLELARAAYRSGEPATSSLGHALRAALLSPRFLFRAEPLAQGTAGRLEGPALAARLAAFFWLSVPDEELLGRAEAGALLDDRGLAEELRRMLDDPRSERFLTHFTEQWLELEKLAGVRPDPRVVPGFDPALLDSMREETLLFVRSLVREERPLGELLLAEHTFVDERLRAHYGLPPGEPGMRRIRWPADSPRSGLLGQAAVLSLGAHPDRTSPVRRGRWVLSQLLCEPPPPPPPLVEGLPRTSSTGQDQRARLAEHRRNPACASCHQRMDPIGLGLEGFDLLGRRAEGPLDERGQLPDGRTFDGPRALSRLLAEGPAVASCLMQKLATVALGRAPAEAERAELEAAVQSAGGADATMPALIRALVLSEAFRREEVRP